MKTENKNNYYNDEDKINFDKLNNFRRFNSNIKGAVSIIALPIPDWEISIGLLIRAKINKAKKIKIGTIKYLFDEVSVLDLYVFFNFSITSIFF